MAFFLVAAVSAMNLWGNLQFGMNADDVRKATPNQSVAFSSYCQARVEPVFAAGRLVAVRLVSQSAKISPEDQKQKFQIVPCETDFRRHLARHFGKAVDSSFMANDPRIPNDLSTLQITSRSRTYFRNCVVAQLYLSHAVEQPSQITFRIAKGGEFSLKSGPDDVKPMDCRQSKS